MFHGTKGEESSSGFLCHDKHPASLQSVLTAAAAKLATQAKRLHATQILLSLMPPTKKWKHSISNWGRWNRNVASTA